MILTPSGVGSVVNIEIWSDIVCPWCYIGKRRFEEALRHFAHREDVTVIWRSFELDPHAPPVRPGDLATNLGRKYGLDRAGALRAIEHMTAQAAGEGLSYDLEHARGGNTFDAHRLLHLAAERGIQDQVKEAFLAAYHVEGVAIGDRAALAGVAVDAGLAAADVDAVLTGDAFAEAVRADEDEAGELGIGGVPFFVIDRRFAVSGAQPADVILSALDRAWQKAHPLRFVGSTPPADGSPTPEGCADGSCAV